MSDWENSGWPSRSRDEPGLRDYLEVLHEAERLPAPKGARSRRRRQRQIFAMFDEFRRTHRMLHSQPDRGENE